ncbi:MAG: signal peptide peptidase SppA [Prolixibacteraceae bacterium]|nr:signal peptide peptidase SppA [Prolixibacteraceae bacterium]MBN2774712.1 signal peptide peptidase SppA [Prolixibacteraceae bacterium]
MKGFFKYVLATIVGIFIVSVLGFFLFFMIIGALVSSTEKTVIVQNNSMLVLNLEKEIVDRAPNDPFEDLNIPGLQAAQRIGLDEILKSIDKAATDDRIKTIYLNARFINGGMASIEEIRNALLKFKEKSGKPIYAYSEMYDQKAYYLATVADKLVIHPLGTVDFRGLSSQTIFFKNALDKLGVEMQILRGPNNKFKGAVEPFMLDKMSPENKEQTMTYLTSLWNKMLEGIESERGIPVDKLNQYADEVLTFKTGQILVDYGLVDEIKYKDEVLEDLRQITGVAPNKGIPIIGAEDYALQPGRSGKGSFSRNKIAVIYASGDIGIAVGSEGIDAEKLSREIRKVRQDSSYKAIVLRIDSPGGSAFESDVILREVKLAAEEKVVVASFGDVAASGGYYIACAADKIVASPNTITGSIGIFGMIPNAGELLNDKLGITFDEVKTNEHSNLVPLTRSMTEFERNLLQQYIVEGYETFINHVSDGRGMEAATVDAIGQGRVWTGENALEIGLVDMLGGLNDAIGLAAEIAGIDDYRTVSLPYLPDPFEELFSTGTNNIRNWWLKKELGANYIFYEQYKKVSQMNGVMARMPYDIEIH